MFLLFEDDDTKNNAELTRLVEHFREQAAMLVDMLDVSLPTVAKLKVSYKHVFHCMLA